MRWSYRLGRLFNIPIRVHVSLLIFMAFIALADGGVSGVVLMLGVFASVVLHELGHALCARSKGLPIGDISLYPFGGVAQLLGAPKTTGDEIYIAGAGPLVSLALGLLLWWFSVLISSPYLWLLAKVNLMLGVFNLLPALPMDGGRIFRAFLARKQGFFKATQTAVRVSRWISFGLLFIGFLTSGWLIIIALFLLITSWSEEGLARMRQYMGDPGYRDAPGPYGPATDPLSWFVSQTPNASGVANRRGNRHEYVDKQGRRVTVEWWES